MKYLQIIIISFSVSISFTQNDSTVFAPIGATWANPNNGDYLKAVRDTLIHGKKATILEKKWTCTEFWSPGEDCRPEALLLWDTTVVIPEIVYTDGDKIYHYLKDSFFLLYDFGVAIGTIMTIHSRERLHALDNIVAFTVMVDALDTFTIDGHQLRAYHISDYEETGASFYRFTGWITERFGKEFYLFPYNNQDEDLFGFPFVAQCYEDHEIQNFTSSDCILSIQEFSTSKFNLYPNPASTSIFIELREFSEGRMASIFDVAGNRIKSVDIANLITEISIHDLHPGYYLFHINGSPLRLPFIVAH